MWEACITSSCGAKDDWRARQNVEKRAGGEEHTIDPMSEREESLWYADKKSINERIEEVEKDSE